MDKLVICIFLIKYSYESCLLYTSLSLCILCDYNTYNEKSIFNINFNIETCMLKIPSKQINRVIYIKPERGCIYCNGSKEKPYDNFIHALIQENIERIKYENSEYSSNLTIILFKGDHYILEKDITSGFLDFFRQINIEINIKPLYCSEENNKNICIDKYENEKPRIVIKNYKFSFYVAHKMILRDIIIDGSDMVLIKEYDNFCKNLLKICCYLDEFKELCKNLNKNYNENTQNLLKNSKGFFNMEKIIKNEIINNDFPIYLSLINIEIINFYYLNEIFQLMFIRIDSFSRINIEIFNVTFNKAFFPLGIIYKLNIYIFYQNNDNFINFINKFTDKVNNSISFINSIFENNDCSLVNFIIMSFIAQIYDYNGIFIFNQNLINNSIFYSVFIKFKSINNDFKLYFNNNTFINNIFYLFIETDFSKYTTSEVIFTNNLFLSNIIFNYFYISFISNFFIRGNFEKIDEIDSFIISKYSNITLNSCIFTDISSTNTYLINFNSIYDVQNSVIFYTAKKKSNFYSNDTLIIFNCSFINNNFLLFKNYHVSLFVKMEFSVFIKLNLTENWFPFLHFTPESNFIINSCLFNKIIISNSLISIESYLKITMLNTIFMNIYCEDYDFINFLTYTKAELDLLISFSNIFLKNIIIVNNFNKAISFFKLNCRETGFGAFSQFNLIYIENIYFKDEENDNSIFGVGGYGLLINNLSLFNSNNCLIIYFKPKFTLSFLNISNIICKSIDIMSGSIYTDAKFEIFYVFNIFFLFNYINSQHCIYIINCNFINVKELILQGRSLLEGSLFFFQINDLKKLFINKIIFKNIDFSNYNSLRISTNSQNLKLIDFKSNFLIKYGIFNSIFENSKKCSMSAINILAKSEIFIQNCSFLNSNSNEGGTIYIMEESYVILLSIYIINSNSENSGGSIYSDSSYLIILNSKIFNSTSNENGGIFFFMNSNIYINACFFFNVSSTNGGGAISSSQSYIIINNCSFVKSKTFYFGGHILCKNCEININFCIFILGISQNYAGSFYFENTDFFIYNSSIKFSSSKMSIISISGSKNSNSNFSKSLFIHNFANSNLFFVTDNNCSLEKIYLFNNIVKNGIFYELYGFSNKISTIVNSLFFSNNSASKNFFKIDNALFKIINTIFIKNFCPGNFIIFLNGISNNFNLRIIVEDFFENNLEEISAFYIEKSEFLIENSTFYMNKQLNAISLIDSLIYLNFSIFLKCFKNNGGAINLFSSKLICDDIEFIQNFGVNGGGIYGKDSNIKLIYCKFDQNKGIYTGSDITLINFKNDNDDINIIEDCIFSNFFQISIEVSSNNILINRSIFKGNDNSYQALFIEKSYLLIFTQNYLINIFGYSQLKIITKLINSNHSNNYIKNCVFINGSGIKGGFIYIEGQNKLILEKNAFINGNSQYGGAIYYFCSSVCGFNSIKNLFLFNKALKSGGAIQYDSNYDYFSEDLFFYNFALVGDNINSYPNKFYNIISENITEILNFIDIISNYKSLDEYTNKSSLKEFYSYKNDIVLSPGNKYYICAILLDKSNNIQKLETNTKLIIEGKNNETNLKLQNNIALFNNGISIFTEFILSSKRNITIDLLLIYKPLLKSYSIIKYFNFVVSNCTKGESYDDQRCKKCQYGQYSLNYNPENNSCINCPSFSLCHGGDSILPYIGYWRKNENSSIIIQCNNEYACPLQNEDSNIYQCGSGYTGNICFYCEENYGKINSQCIKCQENQYFFFISYICGYLFSFIYTLFIEKQKNSDNYIIMLNKILQNHLSVFIVLSALKVTWGSYLKNFMFFTVNYLAIFSPFVFSTDCFIDLQNFTNFKLSLIIAGISPFYLVVFSIIFKFLIELLFILGNYKNQEKQIWKKIKFNFSKYVNIRWILSLFIKYLVIIYLGIYSNILLFFLKIFGCKQIDNSEILYISNFPEFQCYTDTHSSIISMAYFFIFIWSLIFPLIIFIFVYRRKKKSTITHLTKTKIKFKINLNNFEREILENKQFLYNYLINGYKKQFYYWEIIILCRKLFSILVSIGSDYLDISSMGGILIFIFFGFLLLNTVFSPQENEIISKFENMSLFITVYSIGLGIITGLESIPEGTKFFAFSFLAIMNFIFFAFLLTKYFYVFINIFNRILKSNKLNNIWIKKKGINKNKFNNNKNYSN